MIYSLIFHTCVGGAATSGEVLNFMREMFDQSFVSEGYGCTEAGWVRNIV